MNEEASKWYNRRWFILIVAFVVLFGVLAIMMNTKRMDSQNSAKQARQTSLPEAVTAGVTLAWTPNPEPNIAGYFLYYGTGSGVYATPIAVGPSSSMVTVGNLNPGTQYFFNLKAYNSEMMWSPFGGEIIYTIPVPASPTPTATATATPTATIAATPTATATATPTATVAPSPTVSPSPIPNFTLSTLPVSQTITSNATYRQVNFQTVITKSGGFNTLVMLTVSGLPTGIERSFDGNPTNTKRNLKLYSAGFVPPGSYTITVTGQGGLNPALIHTSTATLIVSP